MNFLRSLFNKKDRGLTEAQRIASRINSAGEVPSVVGGRGQNMQRTLLVNVLTELSKRGSKDGDWREDRGETAALHESEKVSESAVSELSLCFELGPFKKDQRQLSDFIFRLETIFSEETRPKRKYVVLMRLLRAIIESYEHLPKSDLEEHIDKFVSMLQEWRIDPYAADCVVDTVLNWRLYPSFQLCLTSSSRLEDLIKAIWKYARERHDGPARPYGSGNPTTSAYVNAAVISLVNLRNPLCREALEEFADYPYDLVRKNAKVGLEILGEPKELTGLIGQLENVMREAYGVGGTEAVEAARRLGELRHRKALDVLKRVAKEARVIDLRDAAEEAIMKIEKV